MGVRENKVETYLDEQVTEHGGITRKWVSPGMDGVPDRIVIYKGRVIFVEVKTKDGVESPAQKRERGRLLATGAQVDIVFGYAGVDAWVREVLLK